ncbi:BlaI/MecI/CopY family transcriptional regulator [Demequina muriae]|uniref:BlaI/MecI/CopY family transcriptional regulator n=1 Tax=Demequina muriae TaxID=3051664 RepID=A0ABT8GDJ5_9MICO|nr:BlaI/MecI/CopY family transcriptional regulator [Demequina sp. EGI L300058]MDN4479500.1 BlaI/MecI/CopY family transcriptional regulator [Demequina sp. EGI L300058]
MTDATTDPSCEPPRLGALEAQVMDVLWDQGPARIRDIIDVLPQDFAYTTIATVLGNLQRKCLVVPERSGRAVHFAARVAREEHTAAVMAHALESSPNRAASMLHFVESMNERDMALLRDYLQQRGGEAQR